MNTVINSQQKEDHQLSKTEAWVYFERAVRELLDVEPEKFLANPENFKENPNYESVMFLLPMATKDERAS